MPLGCCIIYLSKWISKKNRKNTLFSVLAIGIFEIFGIGGSPYPPSFLYIQ